MSKFTKRFSPIFATKLIRQQQPQINGKHLIVRINIQYYPHSDISSLGTLDSKFPVLSHDWLTLYNTGDKQGWRETEDLLQRFGLLRHVKQISIRPVFQCSPFAFCQFLLSLNLIHQQYEKYPFGSSQIT